MGLKKKKAKVDVRAKAPRVDITTTEMMEAALQKTGVDRDGLILSLCFAVEQLTGEVKSLETEVSRLKEPVQDLVDTTLDDHDKLATARAEIDDLWEATESVEDRVYMLENPEEEEE